MATIPSGSDTLSAPRRPASDIAPRWTRSDKHYDAGCAHVAAVTRRRRETVKLKAGSPLLNRVGALLAGVSTNKVSLVE
jgi:hypothetical protein